MEDKELDAPNFLKTAERKKVLSNIESLGLLSAAEKAGLTLSKVLPSECTELIHLSTARNISISTFSCMCSTLSLLLAQGQGVASFPRGMLDLGR